MNGEKQLLNVALQKIFKSPLHKEIKPVNLKGNQLLTPDISSEASTEGLQVDRMDASTTKLPNHGSFKQRVCSSTPRGSSESLKALCTLGPRIPALHSPQQHWRQRKGHSGPWERGMAQGSTGATTYQIGLERTEQAYVAESCDWGVGTRGNQLCMNYLNQTPLEEKSSDKII